MPKYNEMDGAWEPEDSEIDAASENASLLNALRKEPAQTPPSQILFHPELVEREFGSHLLSVPKLTEWASRQGIKIATSPPIEGFQFVQVEAFLCAIERGATESTPEPMAIAIVQSTTHLANDRAAKIAPRWLVGADAHQQWRRLLEKAIEAGEVALLHFGSKLPIQARPAPESAQAEQQNAAPNYAMLATPDQLVAAFGSMSGMTSQWFRSMKDRPALHAAVVAPGTRGRNGGPPYLDVFSVVMYLIDPTRKGRTMRAETGWRLLKAHFPQVHAAHEDHDPNARD